MIIRAFGYFEYLLYRSGLERIGFETCKDTFKGTHYKMGEVEILLLLHEEELILETVLKYKLSRHYKFFKSILRSYNRVTDSIIKDVYELIIKINSAFINYIVPGYLFYDDGFPCDSPDFLWVNRHNITCFIFDIEGEFE